MSELYEASRGSSALELLNADARVVCESALYLPINPISFHERYRELTRVKVLESLRAAGQKKLEENYESGGYRDIAVGGFSSGMNFAYGLMKSVAERQKTAFPKTEAAIELPEDLHPAYREAPAFDLLDYAGSAQQMLVSRPHWIDAGIIMLVRQQEKNESLHDLRFDFYKSALFRPVQAVTQNSITYPMGMGETLLAQYMTGFSNSVFAMERAAEMHRTQSMIETLETCMNWDTEPGLDEPVPAWVDYTIDTILEDSQ